MADDFLRRNALRLLRERWESPSALAQEIYTILSDEPSGGMSTTSPVARAREQAASQSISVSIPEESERPERPRVTQRTFVDTPARQVVDAFVHGVQETIQRMRQPDALLPGIIVTPGAVASGELAYLPSPGQSPTPSFSPLALPSPRPRRDDDLIRQADASMNANPDTMVWDGGSGSGQASPSFMPARSSVEPTLPVPAHVAYAVSPTALAYSYEPLGLPGAYSGQERTAGNYNPAEGPIYREVPADDPFARKYYDLRFFLPDWDSPRAVGAGGSSTTLIGKVVATSKSPVQAILFPKGPDADPGDTVAVKILQLADDENVPKDTWITGILKSGSDYYAQIPVWLSDTGGS